MKLVIALFGLVALSVALPQHGHFESDGGHGGGGGGGGDGGHGGSGGGGGGHGHATSYANIERKDDHEEAIHFKAHPEYHYGFKVRDDKHHVYKTKHEERDGHKVKGSYSLVEPDGKTLRVVDYTADKKQGFIAKVTYHHHH